MDSQLFSLKCNFFVSQRNSTPIYNETKEVGAADVTEMLNNIWKIIIDSKTLEREVIVEADNVAWSAITPNVSLNEIDKFVQIFDIKGKRNHNPTSISMDLLVSLRHKEVHVMVFVYSRNVSTNTTFNIVKETLLDPAIRDRSAAVANELIDKVIEKLKAGHSHHLTTPFPIGWRIWASFITAQPSHSHDQLIKGLPPPSVSEFFRNIATSEAEILTNAQQGLRVARNVNGSQRASLRVIREKIVHLQSIITSCHNEVGTLVTHLEYLEQQADREESLLCDMNSAVQPMESTFSIDTAELVTDCDDIDHMN